jgi:outer membrane receptor for ferrienterochelin and colicins
MSYDLTKVRKDESEGWTNMFGPRRHFSFEGTYEMTDEDSVRFGASFMRESLRQSVQSRGTTWYDNNRQDYHLAYEGTHGKNEYDLKVYHNRLGKHSYLGAGTGYNFDRAEYATSAVEGRVTYRADESHTFTYGTEYRHLEAGSTRYGGSRTDRFQSEGGLTKGYSERGTDQYAFYGADEWKIGKKLLFVPSIRWDHHEDFGSEWSPRAGLTYLMDDHNRFKVNYGFAYRAPSLFERYGDMEETPVPYMTVIVYGNEDLRPEKTRTFDAGYEGEWGKAKGRVTYFYNQARDLIVSKVIGRIPGRGHMTLINSYANVDRATIQGIEGDFHYDFDDHYGIRAAYTYMDGRDDETHEPLSGMARATGLMEVSYTDGKKAPFTVSLAARWNDRYRIESARTGLASLYSYSTMDLSLTKQLGRMMVFAGIDNLFDKTFDTDSSFAIPGRVWKVGAEWKF